VGNQGIAVLEGIWTIRDNFVSEISALVKKIFRHFVSGRGNYLIEGLFDRFQKQSGKLLVSLVIARNLIAIWYLRKKQLALAVVSNQRLALVSAHESLLHP
jgi:hypothetical protein